PTPSHTPGHVCMLYNGVLFAGDLFENKDGNLRPYPPAWNWDNNHMMESAGKVAQLPVKMVCPAHGLPVEGNYRK
ncbi:MAG TPA: MBL fold metallo-hydrolase, partial [Bacillota bacterium]|nr:MBL fold metallo-hydrolase [Bacillota bacterium]